MRFGKKAAIPREMVSRISRGVAAQPVCGLFKASPCNYCELCHEIALDSMPDIDKNHDDDDDDDDDLG